jgi:hypothetical protein
MSTDPTCPASADPQPNPIAARSEADGPLFEYDLNVFYPHEGGSVTESGCTTAAKLVQRLRDEADQIERYSRLLSLPRRDTDTPDITVIRAWLVEHGYRGAAVESLAVDLHRRLVGPLRGGAFGAPGTGSAVTP